MKNLTRVIDDHGQITALTADGESTECPPDKYRDSQTWNVSYSFPKLTNSIDLSAGLVPKPRAVTPHGAHVHAEDKVPLEGTDSKTGFNSWDGHLETRSGHTFVVYREGERTTALLWDTSARLRFTCRTNSDCLIENVGNNEAVHARMLR
jgi:hypothetical protein